MPITKQTLTALVKAYNDYRESLQRQINAIELAKLEAERLAKEKAQASQPAPAPPAPKR